MIRIESQVFLKNDLENILGALDASNAALDEMQRPEGAVYRAGFRDALHAVAAAIGGRLTSGDRGGVRASRCNCDEPLRTFKITGAWATGTHYCPVHGRLPKEE